MSDDIRIGLIGAGTMGMEHILNVAALPGARISALADPHQPSLDQALAAIGGPVQTYSDHRSLLSSGACDAVIVATPNMTHIDVLLDVFTTELHVLVEKPLCTTVADCRRVIAAAAEHRGVAWMGLEYRYMPPVARLIEMVDDGAVGDVRMVAIREHRFPFLTKVDDWNRFNVNTGGTLVEKCCHFFDLMNRIVGEVPTRVFASGGQDVNHLDETYDGRRSDILDNAYVIVDYPSGRRAALDLCMFAEATHNQEEISVVGDRGKIEALLPEGVVRFGRRGEHCIGEVETVAVTDDRIAFEGHHHGSSYLELLGFAAAIRDGSQPEVTLADGLASVAVGEAAHRSIATGQPVLIGDL